jgi:hypothetical protein
MSKQIGVVNPPQKEGEPRYPYWTVIEKRDKWVTVNSLYEESKAFYFQTIRTVCLRLGYNRFATFHVIKTGGTPAILRKTGPLADGWNVDMIREVGEVNEAKRQQQLNETSKEADRVMRVTFHSDDIVKGMLE